MLLSDPNKGLINMTEEECVDRHAREKIEKLERRLEGAHIWFIRS